MELRAAPDLLVRGQRLAVDGTWIMGVVNASPESFSDGDAARPADALRRADELIAAGADVIDVGGQSSVTNQPELDAEQEIARVLPVVGWLAREHPDLLVSVDTYKPRVARACLEAGAAIVNDVSGLANVELVECCLQHSAALVVMHTLARPKQRLQRPDLYADVAVEVAGFLRNKLDDAVAAGLPAESVIVDPGPDFSKTPAQTIALLQRLGEVRELGRPVLLALSRKDFLGAILQTSPRGRDVGTMAAIALLTGSAPGNIVRVHDVAAARQVVETVDALVGRTTVDPDYLLPDELRYESPRR